MKYEYTEEQIKRAVEVIFNNYIPMLFLPKYNRQGKYWLITISTLQRVNLEYKFSCKEQALLFKHNIIGRCMYEITGTKL